MHLEQFTFLLTAHYQQQ